MFSPGQPIAARDLEWCREHVRVQAGLRGVRAAAVLRLAQDLRLRALCFENVTLERTRQGLPDVGKVGIGDEVIALERVILEIVEKVLDVNLTGRIPS